MNVLQLAGALPRDPQFREFVAQWMVPPQPVDADKAAEFIRAVCQVESRRQLAQDRDAEQRFHRFIRQQFVAWRSKQH